MNTPTTTHATWSQLFKETWPIDPRNYGPALSDEQVRRYQDAEEEYVDNVLKPYGLTILGNGEIIGSVDAEGLPEPYTEEYEDVIEALSAFEPDWDDVFGYDKVVDIHINSPRSVANGMGAWAGTIGNYDETTLQYDTDRFHRRVLEYATEGRFGEYIADLIEDEDESAWEVLSATMSEVAGRLGAHDFLDFCTDLFDDPDIAITRP